MTGVASDYVRRLAALEAVLLAAPRVTWHRVIVPIGQTKREAVATYTAERELDVDDVQRNAIYRIIVEARHA